MFFLSPKNRVKVPSGDGGREVELLLAQELEPVLDRVFDVFYGWVVETPRLMEVVGKVIGNRSVEEMVAYLKKKQSEHWLGRLRDGDGDAYRKRIERIGQAHRRIGLDLDFFIKGYALVLAEGTRLLTEAMAKKPCAYQQVIVIAFERQVMEDLNHITNAYFNALREHTGKRLEAVTGELQGQVGTSIATIASATEELSSTAASISSRITTSTEQVESAAAQASAAMEASRELAKLADKINEVVTFINDLSDQTNLLALNASIEAARAGEAGRGFSVVADEVKKLASSTGAATEDIRTQVSQIVDVAHKVQQAIGVLNQSVSGIQEMTRGIADMMQEQTIATGDISSNAMELQKDIGSFLGNLEATRSDV